MQILYCKLFLFFEKKQTIQRSQRKNKLYISQPRLKPWAAKSKRNWQWNMRPQWNNYYKYFEKSLLNFLNTDDILLRVLNALFCQNVLCPFYKLANSILGLENL